ncbi:MAG: MarR family winged helix-turn-helix transcriptional regulator [Cetobacterium sp.]
MSIIIKTIGYEICVIARKIHQKLTLKFKEYDITPEQWGVLKELSKEDKISQNELSIRVEKDKNNIKSIVDKLEQKDYLFREQDCNDKRALLINLTEKANIIIEKLSPLDNEMNNEIFKGIDLENLNKFKAILSRIKNNI